jgi:hypothetical protein
LVSSNIPASSSDEDTSFLPSLDILTDRYFNKSRIDNKRGTC